jgi:hypothetical protein
MPVLAPDMQETLLFLPCIKRGRDPRSVAPAPAAGSDPGLATTMATLGRVARRLS